MEAVQEEGEVGGGLRGEAVALETHVVGERIGGFPAQAEGADWPRWRRSSAFSPGSAPA
jgi:hypothetical protein